MAGEVKMEILFGRSVYVLTRSNCERVLAILDADAELGALLSVLRDDLRKTLSGVESAVTAPNPFDEDTEEEVAAKRDAAEILKNIATLKNVAKENADACGDGRAPRCWFCGHPVVEIPTSSKSEELLYRCENTACSGGKRPAVASHYDCACAGRPEDKP